MNKLKFSETIEVARNTAELAEVVANQGATTYDALVGGQALKACKGLGWLDEGPMPETGQPRCYQSADVRLFTAGDKGDVLKLQSNAQKFDPETNEGHFRQDTFIVTTADGSTTYRETVMRKHEDGRWSGPIIVGSNATFTEALEAITPPNS